MRTRNKVMAISLSVALASCLGLFCYLAIAKSHHSSEREAIDITSPDTLSVLEYDLGVISPGESKTQSIDIRSRVDFPIYCTVRFGKTMESRAFDYLGVSSSFGSEKRQDTLGSCFGEYLYEKRLQGKNDTLKISYTLKEDIPESIAGERLSFAIEISAKNVIG